MSLQMGMPVGGTRAGDRGLALGTLRTTCITDAMPLHSGMPVGVEFCVVPFRPK